ncbi:tripartite tricarboxylate transporter permease [Tateyamaria sp.]|uniref:tripartite tricarboxylate transporter permease n=1 Tax=Tateyamaria sp. TaxID=1929288 RepID=UPI00329F1202
MEIILEALPAFEDAWDFILQPVVLGYLVMGVVMGLCIGVFPGLGGIAGLSLLLPFMFGMEHALGLALIIGMVAVVPTSDIFISVFDGNTGIVCVPTRSVGWLSYGQEGHGRERVVCCRCLAGSSGPVS